MLLLTHFYSQVVSKIYNLASRLFNLSPVSDLTHLRERNVEDLSGGELQRFAIAVVCIQRADM